MTENIERPQIGLEIASTADGRDITRAMTGPLLMPSDGILRTRGAGLRVYEQVKSDWQVASTFLQRRNAVTSAEWQVEAASDRRVDKKAADHLRKNLQAVGWDRVTDLMLWGVFYGYSVAEVRWEYSNGLLGWSGIKVRNRRRFSFTPEGELRLLTRQHMHDGEPAPKPYFWHFATGADHDDEPFGMGLAHWLYWPAFFKRNGIAFWMRFLEKFAAPTAVGKFEPGATSEEKQRLLGALRAIQTDSGIILPKGMEAEFLEAARSGTADYKVLHDTMDEAIAKATLGQTMTTEDGSSQSQAEVHMQVRQDIIKADSDLVCESFNLGPARWLTMFNFDGADPPRVFRMLEEPEDLDSSAERDKKLIDCGFIPSLEYVKERYGDHWEAKPAAAPPPVPEDANTPPAQFAEPVEAELQREEAQNRISQLIDAAEPLGLDWRTFIEPRVTELQTLLDESGDLAEFRERVLELADAPPNSDLADALARSGFAAHLLGRTPRLRA
ncbi:DUF935 domain-containing protein [Pseudoxanthomonas sp. 22568]|uniref:DUF935 domain-containing protein n=1 Tax=Pseudoxanthomonas sp. 22568 TaxID=3453945 RepID=UPI003F84F99F